MRERDALTTIETRLRELLPNDARIEPDGSVGGLGRSDLLVELPTAQLFAIEAKFGRSTQSVHLASLMQLDAYVAEARQLRPDQRVKGVLLTNMRAKAGVEEAAHALGIEIVQVTSDDPERFAAESGRALAQSIGVAGGPAD